MVKTRTIQIKSIENEEIVMITTIILTIKSVIIMLIMIIKNCNYIKL